MPTTSTCGPCARRNTSAWLRSAGSTTQRDRLDSGITLFDGGGLSPEAELVEIFPTIEEHHGEYSHTPPLSEIEVIGAQPTSEVLAELNAYGFKDIVPSQRGFIARRDA